MHSKIPLKIKSRAQLEPQVQAQHISKTLPVMNMSPPGSPENMDTSPSPENIDDAHEFVYSPPSNMQAP